MTTKNRDKIGSRTALFVGLPLVFLGTLFKLTTSGRGKLTSRFAGEDFQFVCIQAVQKMSLFFPFTSNNLPVIMVTNL
jgi:hypothetical protein